MKYALLFGCGAGNGQRIINTLLENNYKIINIGSNVFENNNVVNIQKPWHEMDIPFIQKTCSKFDVKFDIVFFNQNGSALAKKDFNTNTPILEQWKLIKNWTQSIWSSCQMSYLVVHTVAKNLTADSKVGWMLSGFVDFESTGVEEHPDYSSFKFFNLMAMRNFASENEFKTFGVYPEFCNEVESSKLLETIFTDVIDQKEKVKEYKY